MDQNSNPKNDDDPCSTKWFAKVQKEAARILTRRKPSNHSEETKKQLKAKSQISSRPDTDTATQHGSQPNASADTKCAK